MTLNDKQDAIAAASVDPKTIDRHAKLGSQAEVIVRSRPPGSVKLGGGHKEHLLMCTLGTPRRGRTVRSTLASELGETVWNSCPVREVTFIPAGFALEWEWSYSSQSVHLAMAPSFFAEDEAGLPGFEPAPFFRVANPALGGMLWQLGSEISSPGLGRDLATTSLLNLMKVHMRRRSSSDLAFSTNGLPGGGGLSHPQSQRAIEIIQDRLTESISLEELSRECGLSPHHFARMFKRSTGYPPHEYQLRLRIKRALHLLRSTEQYSVAAVAYELGFTDESHFRRHFKRIVGITPGEYRKQQ